MTIIPDYWRARSCPKLPQRHQKSALGTFRGRAGEHWAKDYRISVWSQQLSSGVAGIVIPFLFVLTLVVFFHELGHFLVARWCGVSVLVFSIGFGPELFGFNDRTAPAGKSPPFRSAAT